MLGLPDLLNLLLNVSVPLPLELRANYLLILQEAYLNTVHTCKDIGDSDDFPRLVCDLVCEVIAFVADVLPTACFDDEDDDDGLKQASFIFVTVVPTLTLVYKSHYSPSLLADDPSARLLPHLEELLANAEAQRQTLPPEPVRQLLRAMHTHGFGDPATSGSDGGDAGVAGTLGAANGGVFGASLGADLGGGPSPTSEAEPHPQESLDAFMESFYAAEQGESEINGLVEVFASGLRSRLRALAEHKRRYPHDADPLGTTPMPDADYTRSLMKQLLQVGSADDIARNDEEQQLQHAHATGDADLTTMLMRVLSEILLHADEHERKALQQLLNRLGASTLVLKFASCEDDDLARAGVHLGIAMLEGGNTEVQCSLLALLKSDESSIAAADGSKATFFASMKRRLRLGVKELKDRKIYLAQQASLPRTRRAQRAAPNELTRPPPHPPPRRALRLICRPIVSLSPHPHIEVNMSVRVCATHRAPLTLQEERRAMWSEASEGLSAQGKAMLREDIDRPFASRARLVEVLELLRLMCEGHRVEMQARPPPRARDLARANAPQINLMAKRKLSAIRISHDDAGLPSHTAAASDEP